MLPLLTLGACIAGLQPRLGCWRTAVLAGAVVWGAVLVAATELLSVAHLLTAPAVAVTWLAALGVFGALAARQGVRPARPGRPEWLTASTAVLGALLVVLGLTAVMAPPNTLDSLTYHMPRVLHWIHNASLEPYPTHEPRQLYLQPMAEFAILHLQLLSGGDQLAGLVQWASLLGALVGSSLIARELGVGRSGQVLAAVFAASVPIGVLESTSTQNDYVVTFWLVCLTACALCMMRTPRVAWGWVAVLGLATGLALLTKATAYLFAAPILVWLAARLVRTQRLKAGLPLAAMAGLAILVNAGWYARNLEVFGAPMGPLGEGTPTTSYFNASLSPSLLASNLVRDLGVNLVATPLVPLNVWAAGLVRGVHGLLQVDPADPRTTWNLEPFVAQPAGLAFDENYASNPLHLGLIVAAVAVVGARPGPRRTLAAPYAVALVAAGVVFAAVLRWQPWHTRLELPLFVLGGPLVAAVVGRGLLHPHPRVSRPLALVLLVSMLPWVLYNEARPLVGPRSILSVSRSVQYFANQSSLIRSYVGAAAFLVDHGCSRVGLLPGGYEYLFWALLQPSAAGPIDLEAVDIDGENPSAELPSHAAPAFQPCAVLGFGQTAIRVGGITYQRAWSLEAVTILAPSAS